MEFVYVNQGETFWGALPIDRVLLREYSPADYADDAEEYSRAVLFRREIRLDYWSYWGSSM